MSWPLWKRIAEGRVFVCLFLHGIPQSPVITWKLVRAAQGSSKPPHRWPIGRNLDEASASLLAGRAPRKENPAKVPWRSSEATVARPGTKELHSPEPLILAWQCYLFQDFISIAALNPENLEELLPSLSQPGPQRAINLVIQAFLPPSSRLLLWTQEMHY